MAEKVNIENSGWITDRKPEPYVRVKILYRNRHLHKNIESVGYYSCFGSNRWYKTKTGKHIIGQVIGWKPL